MRLPFKLRAAINLYFAFKYGERINSRPTGRSAGHWSTQSRKDDVCSTLILVATAHKFKIEIVPGVIYLTRGRQTMTINSPVEY